MIRHISRRQYKLSRIDEHLTRWRGVDIRYLAQDLGVEETVLRARAVAIGAVSDLWPASYGTGVTNNGQPGRALDRSAEQPIG